MEISPLPHIPSLCDVCLRANSMQIVPNRGEDESLMDIKYQVFSFKIYFIILIIKY